MLMALNVNIKTKHIKSVWDPFLPGYGAIFCKYRCKKLPIHQGWLGMQLLFLSHIVWTCSSRRPTAEFVDFGALPSEGKW